MMRRYFFVYDVETSGSCPIRNGPIWVVILVVDAYTMLVVETFERSIRPPMLNTKSWSSEAEKYHGITYQEVLNFQDNKSFCLDFLWFMKKYKDEINRPLPFVSHASPTGRKVFNEITKEMEFAPYPWIDYNFLMWCFIKEGLEYSFYKVCTQDSQISTVKIARELGFKGNRLNQWAERLGFPLNHHDPKSDALCTLELYKYLLNYQGQFNGSDKTDSAKSKVKPKKESKKITNNLQLGI